MRYDEVFLTYLECAKHGDWDLIDNPLNVANRLEALMTGYVSRGNQAQVWIVRPDGVKRAFSFPTGTHVWIGSGVVKFYGFEAIEELTVDEIERAGPVAKLDFSR